MTTITFVYDLHLRQKNRYSPSYHTPCTTCEVAAASTSIIIIVILAVSIVGAYSVYVHKKHKKQMLYNNRRMSEPKMFNKINLKDVSPRGEKTVELANIKSTITADDKDDKTSKATTTLSAATNPVEELSDIVGCWKVI